MTGTKRETVRCIRCQRNLPREQFGITYRKGTTWERVAARCNDCRGPREDRPAPKVSEHLCECGCGAFTNFAQRNSTSLGHVAGEPMRYIAGHGSSVTSGPMWVVEPDTGCWLWQRNLVNGRGQVGLWDKDTRQRMTRQAHRWVYETHREPIPEGLELDHLCANGQCVNPDHLEPVTHAENMRRNVARMRFAGLHWIRTGEKV